MNSNYYSQEKENFSKSLQKKIKKSKQLKRQPKKKPRIAFNQIIDYLKICQKSSPNKYQNFSICVLDQILHNFKLDEQYFEINPQSVKNFFEFYKSLIYPTISFFVNANQLDQSTFVFVVFLILKHQAITKMNYKKYNAFSIMTFINIAVKMNESSTIHLDHNLKYVCQNEQISIDLITLNDLKQKIFVFEAQILEEMKYELKIPYILDIFHLLLAANNIQSASVHHKLNQILHKYLEKPHLLFCREQGQIRSAQEIFGHFFQIILIKQSKFQSIKLARDIISNYLKYQKQNENQSLKQY